MKGKFKEIIILIFIIVIFSIFAIIIKNKIMKSNAKKEQEELSQGDVEVNVKDEITDEEIKKDVEQNNNNNEGSNTSGDTNISNNPKPNDKIVIKNGCIGVIDIPSIGVRAQIKEGTDDETIKYYVGKFKSSGEFGEIGNVSLAAHNNVYTEIFRNLNKLQIGSYVRIITRTNEYVYQMTSKTVVSPDDNTVLDGNSNKKEITLITCTPTAASRVVVKGELVSNKKL